LQHAQPAHRIDAIIEHPCRELFKGYQTPEVGFQTPRPGDQEVDLFLAQRGIAGGEGLASRPILLSNSFTANNEYCWRDHPASARFVGETARTGRHHALATLNLSQSVRDYEGALGRVVLDNAAVQLLLRQGEEGRQRVGAIFGLTPDEEAELAKLRTVKGQKAGAYLVARAGADAGTVDLYVTPEEYWLFTSHQPDRQLRELLIARHSGPGGKTAAAVWAAVRELAALTPEARETLRPRHVVEDAAPASERGRPALVPSRPAAGIE